MTTDPLADVAAITGVGSAAAHARDAIDALLRHPSMRRHSATVASESAVRGARASAELAGADPDDLADPVLQGALRVTSEVPTLAANWNRAPGQVLARVHMLVARDLTDESALGRPRAGVDRTRFDQLLELAATPSTAPAVVLAAIAHGELASMMPFGAADDVTARAVERIVLVAAGLDTKAVSVPEAGHRALGSARGTVLESYESGTPDGVGAWVRYCCDAYARGAEEGLAICASL